MAIKVDPGEPPNVEEPLNTEIPIIDPHHHLWDNPGSLYLLNEFLEDVAGGHNITQTVFVECLSHYRQGGPPEMAPVGETEFVRKITSAGAGERFRGISVADGIVGFADLTLGNAVEPVLEAHIEAGEGRVKGIRHAGGWHESNQVPNGHTNPSRGLLMEPRFRQGFACLERFGLSFDACVYHSQLAEVADLAKAFPETPLILDHIGTPIGIGPYAGKRDEVTGNWMQGIAQLAPLANVTVKLGGLGMNICGFEWGKSGRSPTSMQLAELTSPYYLFCIQQFGPDRCMFESNFPVDKAAFSYCVLWNSFKRMTADFSKDERSALFHDTAARCYRLDDDR